MDLLRGLDRSKVLPGSPGSTDNQRNGDDKYDDEKDDENNINDIISSSNNDRMYC